MVWVERGVLAGLIVLALVPLALLVMTVLNIPPVSNVISHTKVVTHTIVKTEVINNTIIKYVNHTIYINQTVPVPVYINRTIYVPVPTNSSSVPSMFDMGTCHLYSLVFSNGTVWTLGYWIPTPQAWEIYGPNGSVLIWGRAIHTAGVQYITEFSIAVMQPSSVGEALLPLLTIVPYNTTTGWVDMVYMGDWGGIGPTVVTSGEIEGDTLVLPAIGNTPPVALPFNTTVTVVIMIYNPPSVKPFLLPCNWTVIKTPLTPEQALALPAPMGELIISEAWYVDTGLSNNTMPLTHTTWGYLEWRVNVQPMNVTNLPWPIG